MNDAKDKRGRRIKELRLNAGMTMAEIAKKIGVATQTIFKYEEGIITNIPLDKIEMIASIFDVAAPYVAGWVDDPKYSVPEDKLFESEFRALDDEKKNIIIQVMKSYRPDQE